MLDAIAQLAQHGVGDICRVLGDEIDANALGADQTHHLFDLFQQRLGRIAEQQMGFVEEKHQTRFVGVADLGQFLEQLAHQPEQEGRVEPGVGNQLVGRQQVYVALARGIGAHDVGQLQRRFAEQVGAALVLQHQQTALDGGDGGRRDVAVTGRQVLGVRGGVGQRRLQVLQVQQQQAFLVGGAEHHREHTLLNVVELEHPRDQQRTHFRDRGTDRVARLAEQIPEHRGGRSGFDFQVHGRRTGQHLFVGRADGADPG